MRFLLDTHALLWFIEGDKKLSAYSRELIEDTDNEIFVSMISFFEIAIKTRLGKMVLTKPLKEIAQDTLTAEIKILPITQAHIFEYENVPLVESHRDPFDRLLIATALHENMAVITVDEKFKYYESLIELIW